MLVVSGVEVCRVVTRQLMFRVLMNKCFMSMQNLKRLNSDVGKLKVFDTI